MSESHRDMKSEPSREEALFQAAAQPTVIDLLFHLLNRRAQSATALHDQHFEILVVKERGILWGKPTMHVAEPVAM